MEQSVLEKLAALVATAEVVSFDVFDTLFVRPLCDPEDLFDLIGERFGISGFRESRRAAQARAFQTMHANGLKEITLDGIYESFDRLSVDPHELKKEELSLELAFTLPNAELIDFFLALVRSGKRVVITSDMYLPLSFFEALLTRNGLPMVPLFVSSDRNATKRDDGELFEVVARTMGVDPKRILHIGDNQLSDIRRAKDRQLATFHYVDRRRALLPQPSSTSASIAYGVSRVFSHSVQPGSFESFGFEVGGPAALGFLHWIRDAAERDEIDLLLFTSRDGYVLERATSRGYVGPFPRSTYFKSSRIALTLAGTDENNFEARLPFLLSGAQELSAFELLERIGVTPPADNVMRDIGLGPEVRLTDATVDLFRSFLWASRWEILKRCRATRAGLFSYLRELGVEPGMRVAMVDVGWNGTTQEAFSDALRGLIDVDLYGYYLSLTEQPECVRRKQTLRMDALLSARSVGQEMVDRIYANRVAIELCFSAPHSAVVGYDVDPEGRVIVVEDAGRGDTAGIEPVVTSILSGVEKFGEHASAMLRAARIQVDPVSLVEPMLRFVRSPGADAKKLLSSVTNFDAWASSRNRAMRLDEYMP